MTNTSLLKKAIRKSGLKIRMIMDQLQIKSYSTLRDKIENRREFTASEIMKLCEILNLTAEEREAIFFAYDAESYSA